MPSIVSQVSDYASVEDMRKNYQEIHRRLLGEPQDETPAPPPEPEPAPPAPEPVTLAPLIRAERESRSSFLLRHVARHFGWSVADLNGKQRVAPLVHARQVAMFLHYYGLGHSLTHTGRLMGDRDHTTVLHACRQIADEYAKHPAFAAELAALAQAAIGSSPAPKRSDLCVFDLPLPPSVNTTRKVDWKNRNRLNRWINAADAALMASGQFKSAQKNIVRFELHVVLDDEACRLDLDNGVKTLVDYLVRVGILANDSKKHWRKLTLEWGAAPAGCRITVKPLDD